MQQRVMELEAENASLRKAIDPAEQLARGSDAAEFWIAMQSEVDARRTVDEFRVHLTWDELLVASFSEVFPKAGLRIVYKGVRALVQEKLCLESANGNWTLLDDSLSALVDRVKRQFLGLSYIDVIDVNSVEAEVWSLTREGRVQLAILKGDTRDGGTPWSTERAK